MSAPNEAVIAAEMEATSAALMDVLNDRIELAGCIDAKRGILAGAAMATAEMFMGLRTDGVSVQEVQAYFRNTLERAWDVAVAVLADEGKLSGGSLN